MPHQGAGMLDDQGLWPVAAFEAESVPRRRACGALSGRERWLRNLSPPRFTWPHAASSRSREFPIPIMSAISAITTAPVAIPSHVSSDPLRVA